jgi:SAM-dependent methyltransferase
LGDMSALPVEPSSASHHEATLRPASVDVVCTIATWHEVEGRIDLLGLARLLRPGGRLVIIDWRRDAVSWESGPPREIRFTKEEVAQSLAPHFSATATEHLGSFMFAVVARREDDPAD